MPSRFETQQLTQVVDVWIVDGEDAALGDGGAVDEYWRVGDDAERVAGGAVVETVGMLTRGSPVAVGLRSVLRPVARSSS